MKTKDIIHKINLKAEAALKEIVELKARLRQTEEELRVCITKFDALSDLKLLADREIVQLKETIKLKDNDISELSASLLEKTQEFTRLSVMHQKLEEEDFNLKEMLKDKNTKLNKLEKELAKEKKDLKEKSKLLTETEEKLQKLSLRNQQLQDEIDALNEINRGQKN